VAGAAISTCLRSASIILKADRRATLGHTDSYALWKPTKGHASESDWETGVKIGYFLGLSPTVLSRAGELDQLSKQRKAIKRAVREGAMPHLRLDEAFLRAELVTARRRRDTRRESLRRFKVDDQYAEHQERADQLTATIQSLNDEAVSLQRRAREISEAVEVELTQAAKEVTARLQRVYAEVGLALPSSVTRRFAEVENFHQSVLRNRQLFLEEEAGHC
jgi:phage host-nuclease inhibitor protein Gam